MNEIWMFLILTLPAAGVCLAALIQTISWRPHRPSALSGLLLCSFMVLAGQFLELNSQTPERILLFSRITYLFIALCPVFWFLFSLELSLGLQRFLARLFLCMAIMPIATTAIAWTNPLHGWLWRGNTFRSAGGFLINVVLQYGPWFWFHFAYSYVLYLIGIVLIVREFFRQHRFYHYQSFWVLAGGLLPLVTNLAYICRLFGPYTKDFSALAVSLSGACFTIGIRRYRLARMRPFPRDEVYMQLGDPVAVLDDEKRIIDWNAAASRIFSNESVGRRLDELLSGLEKDFPSAETLSRGFRASSWPESGKNVKGELRVCPISRRDAGGYSVTFLGRPEEKPSAPILSRRERQILALVVKDLSNKEIAECLYVTESTIKSHVHSLLKKAGVERRGELRVLLPKDEGPKSRR